MICQCPPGYRGEMCDETYCETPCDPNYGFCDGPNKCNCTIREKGGKFCNISQCINDFTYQTCHNGGLLIDKLRYFVCVIQNNLRENFARKSVHVLVFSDVVSISTYVFIL
ncbi:hypothetical protein RF11_12792 [Thelohanellus kitauei]|uniref:EGF-like domain-containing protein n=1 Tax=Thelohanellus kitauei TaxID=669202 RepID=A0A0C2I803_THEKT|nr:hypothetical protein RF11_12792 [Thelohanellus kitauei]